MKNAASKHLSLNMLYNYVSLSENICLLVYLYAGLCCDVGLRNSIWYRDFI